MMPDSADPNPRPDELFRRMKAERAAATPPPSGPAPDAGEAATGTPVVPPASPAPHAANPAAPAAASPAATSPAPPAAITAASIVRRHPDVTGRRIADKYILVPLRRGMGEENHLYTCNAVGRDCWETFDGVAPLEEIARRVAATFDDAVPDQVLRDLVGFVEELQTIGAVEIVPRGAA